MPSVSNDIDSIWDSMQRESTKPKKMKELNHLWESKPSSSRKRPQTRKGRKGCFPLEDKRIPRTHCSTDKRKTDAVELVGPTLKDTHQICQEIIDWAETIEENAYIELGDSDDESDDDEETKEEEEEEKDSEIKSKSHDIHGKSSSASPNTIRKGNDMRMERLVSTLQSSSLQDRIRAIEVLKDTIASLLPRPECLAPPLDFPAPFDPNRITLTHKQYGAVVSDMANVAPWARWQRTCAPLSSQFQDNQHLEHDTCEGGEGIGRGGGGGEEEEKIETYDIDKVKKDIDQSRNILQTILHACGTALFRRFCDKSERCRLTAIHCVQSLCLASIDIGKHVAYLLPAVLSRYPPVAYDEDMQVFVQNVDDHEYYKRGGAIERQDRGNLISSASFTIQVMEPCEEVRLALCNLISCLLRCVVHCNATSMLNAYFSDIVFAVQSHLSDSFPTLKIAAAKLLVQILRVPQWEMGAKHFATAIARAVLPNLRHRNSRVRIASLDLFEASVSVPNREKIKGAGSAAIVDLVGFREENELPVAAFYKNECGVTVNILAELARDKNPKVRIRCCSMLAYFMICLPDRYDHHQRLLPYLLTFYNDHQESIRDIAIEAVENCGQQYEAEHSDEIIERRQYGVDGSEKCNHEAPLPAPFKARPRLGARLFVRNNTKRFFLALLNELTCWISKTREQSIQLISTLVIYCEEHLTMDFHQTLSCIVKAIQMLHNEKEDKAAYCLMGPLLDILKLAGRYVDPDTYVPLLLPRVIGDTESATTLSEGGHHSETARVANALALRSMICGTLPQRILPHTLTLIPALCSDKVIGCYIGIYSKTECMKTLVAILERIKGKVNAGALTAHFQSTGKLTNLTELILSCRSSLAVLESKTEEEEIALLAKRGLNAIPQMDSCGISH